MKKLRITLIALMLMMSFNAQSQEDTDNEDAKISYSAAINPAYFALGGFSFAGNIIFPERWTLTAAVEGGFELPDDFRDIFFDDNQNINVNWDYLVAAEASYRFNKATYNKGLYAYATLGYEGWTVDEIGTNEDTTFENWFSSIGIGYNWYPFKKKNFHVSVAYNVIFILNNTEDQLVGNTNFNIESVIPPSFIPNRIFIGWRF